MLHEEILDSIFEETPQYLWSKKHSHIFSDSDALSMPITSLELMGC